MQIHPRSVIPCAAAPSFILEVFGPGQDIHSGEYGGVIQNPIHVLSKLIADLHDEHGQSLCPVFTTRFAKVDDEEHAELARLPFDDAFLRKHSGAPALWGEPEFTPVERIGARPTMEVVQFEAGQPKSAIPAKATARISFRLVPDQDPAEVHQQFRQYLESHLPSHGEMGTSICYWWSRYHHQSQVSRSPRNERRASNRLWKTTHLPERWRRNWGRVDVQTNPGY